MFFITKLGTTSMLCTDLFMMGRKMLLRIGAASSVGNSFGSTIGI